MKGFWEPGDLVLPGQKVHAAWFYDGSAEGAGTEDIIGVFPTKDQAQEYLRGYVDGLNHIREENGEARRYREYEPGCWAYYYPDDPDTVPDDLFLVASIQELDWRPKS